MTAAALRNELNRQPFRPFVLTFSTGRRVQVTHPEAVVVVDLPGYHDAIVADDAGRSWMVDLAHIVELERVAPPESAPASA